MAATNSAAAGTSPIITFPPRGLQIRGNVTLSKFCDDGRNQFHMFSLFADTLRTTLAADLSEMLRAEGLDGQQSFAGFSWGSSAKAAGTKATKPLTAISAEAENISRMFMVLDRAIKANVFDPLTAVEEARKRQKNGAGLKLGA